MKLFLWGACAMASAVIALFFWRFYRDVRDRLLAWFALAFATFTVHWTGLAIMDPREDTRHYFYVVRLVAFLFILVAIVDKNRRRDRSSDT
jgi:hypothetical protein